MYKPDLALNNQQWLIYQTQTKRNQTNIRFEYHKYSYRSYSIFIIRKKMLIHRNNF